jgi:hypothetical protein
LAACYPVLSTPLFSLTGEGWRDGYRQLSSSVSVVCVCAYVCPTFLTSPVGTSARSPYLNDPRRTRASGFAGLFHPATTSRVSVQGFGPAPQLYRLVAGLCPPALSALALTGCPAATLVRRASRLSSAIAGRSSKSVVGLPRRRSPLRCYLLQALRPDRAITPLQCNRSARDLAARVFTLALPLRCSPRRRSSACRQSVRRWLVSEFTRLLEVCACRRTRTF